MGRALATAFAAAALAVAMLAAQADNGRLPVPTFRAEANYVRVDAFPTRDGMPVTDLAAADFDVLEDKVPQKIEQFERVVIRAAGVGEGRPEPNTVAESQRAIQDPRARVFVLFLDPAHVEQGTSRHISQELIVALNRLIGPDDYVGVMIPPMRLRDVTFARRTVAIENLLRNDWWGKRDAMLPVDEDEEQYSYCYGSSAPKLAQQMILRHRELQTFDALEDLVVSVRTLREERKAVLAITDGWIVYRPDSSLLQPIGDTNNTPPANPPIGVDPRNGRLTTSGPNEVFANAQRKCEFDRQTLANLDDETRLRTIMDEANRSNTAFYPLDPRGLVVFDDGIVPSGAPANGLVLAPTTPADQDLVNVRARETSIRRLAEGTDGTAIVGTNMIREALRRVVDDLSSYYLIGYYSTGKLDGKFHSITVRVKRPGVTVRARRGYQALRAADVARAATPATVAGGAPAALTGEAAVAAAASTAVGKIVNSARDMPLHLHVVAGWHPDANGKPAPSFWTIGEVVDRIPGANFDAVLLDGTGEVVANARGRIMPGTTSALVIVAPDKALQAGEYTMRVRSQSPSGSETVSMPVTLPPAPQSSGAVFIRRGPMTGNKEQPTADLRFHRSERLRVEVPAAVDVTSARLLDRTGKPMTAIPVTASTRKDEDGIKWATAELVLAPLGPGDYVVEVVAGETRTLAAFRIVL